jgi:hypothetical protein
MFIWPPRAPVGRRAKWLCPGVASPVVPGTDRLMIAKALLDYVEANSEWFQREVNTAGERTAAVRPVDGIREFMARRCFHFIIH